MTEHKITIDRFVMDRKTKLALSKHPLDYEIWSDDPQAKVSAKIVQSGVRIEPADGFNISQLSLEYYRPGDPIVTTIKVNRKGPIYYRIENSKGPIKCYEIFCKRQ
ncbi:MAG: hypothetical protein ABIF10_08485 [Candidatus Woesearchaeota archaeon]